MAQQRCPHAQVPNKVDQPCPLWGFITWIDHRDFLGRGAVLKGISLALLLVLIGLCSLFLGERDVAWAAEAHAAHLSSAALQYSASTSSLTKASVTLSTDKSSLTNPILVNNQWVCPPPLVPQAKLVLPPGEPDDGPDEPNPQYTEACVQGGLFFTCSDVVNPQNGSIQPSEKVINQDWLSGDVPIATGFGHTYYSAAGHLIYTRVGETFESPEIRKLSGYMEGLAFLLITPSIILLGYQIMLGVSTFRYAGALDGLSRVVLGGLAVAGCYILIATLNSLETIMVAGILILHIEHPFPHITVNGDPVPYMLYNANGPGEPTASYRGIVMPMTRWGCAVNDFIGIFAVPFVANTLASIIPLFRDATHYAGTVTGMGDVIYRIGQMVQMVLSVVLWIQVFVRIVLLNYYILTGPLAFGCWALPGGVGQRVVRLWCKGFFSVLFVQVLQVFLLTTLPLLLPTLPQISADSVGLIQGFMLEFPPILTLYIALMAPRLLGASAAKALGTASSMAGGVMVAVGSVVSRIG